MVIIYLPKNNEAEREYAVYILLGLILSISFKIEYHDKNDIILKLPNQNHVIFKDHFFSSFPVKKSYLKKDALPSNIYFIQENDCPFLSEKDLPIIFGTCELEISDKKITCGCDIFAATFFCLSRWEEFVSQNFDHHGRFPAAQSLAHIHGFLKRPLVNEMALMLRGMLAHLKFPLPEIPHQFRFVPTHDIDMPYLWKSNFYFLKKTGGDLFLRRNINEAIFNVKSFLNTKFKIKPDPCATYNYLMDISEKYGFKSYFFFLSGGTTKYDNSMEKEVRKLAPIIENIKIRDHKIGIHPSYDTIENIEILEKEKKRFESIFDVKAKSGRQHFLRFKIPYTWKNWDSLNMGWDSSMGYPEESGFRCGICQPFPVFDILERKKLELWEMPLTAMDTTYPVYKKISPSEMKSDILSLMATVKKYRGTFVLLWHNSSLLMPMYLPYAQHYEDIFSAASTP